MKMYWEKFDLGAFLWVFLVGIAAIIFLLTFGCGKDDREDGGTTVTVFQPQAAPPGAGAPPVLPDGTPGDSELIVPEEDGADDGGAEPPTVVSSKDTVGPCIGGTREVTHQTTYSDGTMASSISTEPCGGVEPVDPPVPAD